MEWMWDSVGMYPSQTAEIGNDVRHIEACWQGSSERQRS